MKDKIIIMTEKTSEYQLRTILNKNNFNKEFLFDSPSSNKILKELFKNSSKNNSGNQGIPDCIYFDNETLIIMECKSDNLQFAEKDYFHYYNFVKDTNYKIYGICFVNENTFSIFEKENKIEKLICLESFNLKRQENFNINMEQKIHEMHNYIRKNTCITDDDKPFFIASCLIFLKHLNNKNLFETLKQKENIYIFFKENLKKYKFDENIFSFIETNIDNTHLWNITKIMSEFLDISIEQDILQKFYHEFLKYSNEDTKKRGIIHTEDHIVKLMNKILNIEKTDIFIDTCAGTGNFLLNASKITKNLIGYEKNNKLFNLLKCNFILRNLEIDNVFNINCFEKNQRADKSAINPPYGLNGNQTELHFIKHQMESINENGLFCSIIPIGCFRNKDLRNEIMKKSKLKKVILCNPKLFSPRAEVQTIIVLFEKNENGHDYNNDIVNFYDYRKDEIQNIIHNGKIKNKNFDEKFDNILNTGIEKKINKNEEWWFCDIFNENIEMSIEYYKKQKEIKKFKKDFELKLETLIKSPLNKNNNIKYKDFIIRDLFEIIIPKNPRQLKWTQEEKNKGIYPFITSSKFNNGETSKINEWKYNFENYILTIAKDGSVGSCFVRNGKFSISSHCYILKPKIEISYKLLKYIAFYITNKLSKKYNFSRALNSSRLETEILELPINENNEFIIH